MRAASVAITFEPAGEKVLKGKAAPGQRVARGSGRRHAGRRESQRGARAAVRRTRRRDAHPQGAAATRPPASAARGWSRSSGWPESARRAWAGSSTSTSTASSRTSTWHQGRSPAYGEGITFWALGEMVRKRAGLAESDDAATTRERIAATVAEYVPDAEERRWIEPRLLQLLGVEEGRAGEREELFAAWRTFFERVGPRPDDPALRGPPVGRSGPARLHRPHARVEPRPSDPDRDAGAAGPARAPARLGRRTPQLRLPLARAAQRRGDVRGPRRPRPRPAGRRRTAHPRTRRRRAALRRRDRPDAAARGSTRCRGGCVPAGRRPVPSRDPRVAAGADRRASTASIRPIGPWSRRPPSSASASRSRRRRRVGPEIPRRWSRGCAPGPPRVPGAQRRPAVAGARTVQLRPSAHPRGRVRDALSRDRRTRHLAAARYFESLDDDEIAGVLATPLPRRIPGQPEGDEGAAVATQARIALAPPPIARPPSIRTTRRSRSWIRRSRSRPTRPIASSCWTEPASRPRPPGATKPARHISASGRARPRHRRPGCRRARNGQDRRTLLRGGLIDQGLAEIREALRGPRGRRLGPGRRRTPGAAGPGVHARGGERAGGRMGGSSLEGAERLDMVPAIAEGLITKATAMGSMGRLRESEALLAAP